MKKRKSILYLFFLTFFLQPNIILAQNWQIGLTSGVSYNKVAQPNSLYPFVKPPAWNDGFLIALSAQRETKYKFLFFSGNVGYIQKKQRWDLKDFSINEGVYTQLNRNYIQTNLFANARTKIENLSVFGGAGLHSAFWQSGKWETVFRYSASYLNIEDWLAFSKSGESNQAKKVDLEFPKQKHIEKYEFDKSFEIDNKKDNRLDLGLAFRAGLQYDINRFSVIAEYNLLTSFLDLNKNKGTKPINYSPTKNLTQTLQLGVLYSIKRK